MLRGRQIADRQHDAAQQQEPGDARTKQRHEHGPRDHTPGLMSFLREIGSGFKARETPRADKQR